MRLGHALAILPTVVLAVSCATVAPLSRPSPPPQSLPTEVAVRATASWKYDLLVTTLYVPDDVRTYGDYYDWGFWPGGTYAGVTGLPPGYWVYVAPTWYLWQELRTPGPTAAEASAPVPPAP